MHSRVRLKRKNTPMRRNSANNVEFNAILLFSLFIFGFLYRLGLPVGDEPDFVIRVREIVEGDLGYFIPYTYLKSIVGNMAYDAVCEIDSSPLSPFAKIDFGSCVDSLDRIVIRLIVTSVIFSPILLLILFRKRAYLAFQKLGLTADYEIYSRKIDSVSLSLILPASFYYYGLLSIEQFFLFLSLFLYLFWGRWITLFLLVLLANVDFGNFTIVTLYVLVVMFFNKIRKGFGWGLLLAMGGSALLLSYTVGYSILDYVAKFPFLNEKSNMMILSYQSHQSLDKYPIILRPVITYMSFVFYTAENIKVIVLYCVYALALAYLAILIVKYRETLSRQLSGPADLIELRELDKDIVCTLSGVLLSICLVFLFPTYANAKYFYFIIPFVLGTLLHIVSRGKILLFIVASNGITLGHLFAYQAF